MLFSLHIRCVALIKELDIEVDVINQPSKDVYTRYKIYCNDNTLTPLAHNAFSENLSRNYGIATKTVRVNGKCVKVFRRCE
jgi:putative DNA primase/helicase